MAIKLNNISDKSATKTVDPVTTIKNGHSIQSDGEGFLYVVTPLAFGRGQGKQIVREDDLVAFTAFLVNLAENGIDSGESEEGYVPASVMAKRTVCWDKEAGKFYFHTTADKGAKPASLTPDELKAVAEHFAAWTPTLPARFADLSKALSAAKKNG